MHSEASTVVSLLLMAVFTWLSGIAIARHHKGRVNRCFALLCLLMAVLSMAKAMAGISRDDSGIRLWLRIGMAVWPFSLAAMLLFGLAYTKARSGSWKTMPMVALLPLCLALSILNMTVQDPRGMAAAGYWSTGNPPLRDGIAVLLAAAWGVSLTTATLVLLLRHRRRMREPTARRQASFVAVGFALPLLSGILTQGLLPMAGISIPPLADVSGLWLVLCVGYAMWRYELFVVDPALAADRILSVMRDAVLLLDTQGTVVYANGSALRTWALPSRTPVGRSVGEVLGPGFTEAGGLERLLGNGRGAAMEITSNAASGARVSLLVSGAVLRSDAGTTQGAVLVAADISGQKQLEGRLQESRRMLRNAVDSSQADIIMIDPQGVVQVCNEPLARHYGAGISSIVGRNVFSLFPEDIGRERKDRFLQVLATGAPSIHEETSGGRHWVHRLTPVKDDAGRVTGVTVFSLDISDRIEAERARERLIEELRGALARVKTLTGLIPICSHCKRIRNDKGYWQQVEQYVAEHTDADFTHGLCNDCLHRLYPEVAKDVLELKRGRE